MTLREDALSNIIALLPLNNWTLFIVEFCVQEKVMKVPNLVCCHHIPSLIPSALILLMIILFFALAVNNALIVLAP
jgi:hypothetical protein